MVLVCGFARAADSPAVGIRAAIQKEIVDGDLPGAIRMYQAVAVSGIPSTAAQALLRMGRCYERLGDAKARDVYQQLVASFPDEKNAVQEARARLATLARAQETPRIVAGWYNGEWQSGIPGLANWYRTPHEFSRVYDDFVVPKGGWTVVAVFSDNRMDFSRVESASWEIRQGVSPQTGGRLIASGVNPAIQTMIPGNGQSSRGPLVSYRIQVNGLRLQLAPGRYWLSVAPVGSGKSYLDATLGRNALGNPPGTNGLAFLDSSLHTLRFEEAETVGSRGQLGIARDFSQGVLILDPSR
jgi:hypothetical protein